MRLSLHEEGGRINCRFRASLLMAITSHETWEVLDKGSSPSVRSHCATSLMARPHTGPTQSHARIVEETINPSLLLILDIPAVTLPLQTLDLLSNTGPESCSNPFSSQCLWYCLKSDHLDHRCHFSIPPYPPSSSPSLLSRVSTTIQTGPVCIADFKSIYLSVSLLCW